MRELSFLLRLTALRIPMFPSDFKEILFAFNSRSVKYLVIGGYAVMVHSQPRATKNLDVLLGPGIENAEAVYAALSRTSARPWRA